MSSSDFLGVPGQPVASPSSTSSSSATSSRRFRPLAPRFPPIIPLNVRPPYDPIALRFLPSHAADEYRLAFRLLPPPAAAVAFACLGEECDGSFSVSLFYQVIPSIARVPLSRVPYQPVLLKLPAPVVLMLVPQLASIASQPPPSSTTSDSGAAPHLPASSANSASSSSSASPQPLQDAEHQLPGDASEEEAKAEVRPPPTIPAPVVFFHLTPLTSPLSLPPCSLRALLLFPWPQ